MASELSKGTCHEALDEKEEGEISLEDVSSSEEGHVNYAYVNPIQRCLNCSSTQHAAAWCTAHIKVYYPRRQSKREVDLVLQDPVKGKENRHHVKEAGSAGTKHGATTLQEKNDDLVPISSDSDMEIVGLADNSKQIVIHAASKSRVKKKKKKKRTHGPAFTIDDLVTPSAAEVPIAKCVGPLKHDVAAAKSTAVPRTHHRDISPVHRSSRARVVSRSPTRRHRSPIRTRSPLKRSRSPIIHPHSPIIRRSPKRAKSPRRSPSNTVCRKTLDPQASIDSHNYVETQKLLKKVRQLKAVGTQSLDAPLNKNKEHASSLIRRSPKRAKSPRRSPTKSTCRKTLDMQSSIDAHNYVDTQKLLKKVRQLKAVGTQSLEATLYKNKEHASSLKEKLSIMMKGMSDNNGNIKGNSKEKCSISVKEKTEIGTKEINDADDEEDLALLRQQALETKQNKLSKNVDRSNDETVGKAPINTNDDQDEEDLELRMIALRSAVLKQHEKRIQKGMKGGKCKRPVASRSESPFTQSFLDSIPIPGEELSPPCTPPSVSDSNHTEDMELDTDVEREKEKLPYSPTDKIITNVPMDTELLGIQPSDVSFINVTESNLSPTLNPAFPRTEHKILPENIVENLSYLPNATYCSPSRNELYEATNANLAYSPSDPTVTPTCSFTKKDTVHLTMQNYAETLDALQDDTMRELVDSISIQEMPYSPTDTPIYDPDLLHALPQISCSITTSDPPLISPGSSYSYNMHTSVEQYTQAFPNPQTEITKQTKNSLDDDHSDKMDTDSLDPAVGSASPLTGSASPTCSMITIDDLPETDVDASSPTTDSLKTMNSVGYIPDHLSDNVKVDSTLEPLYMKGVPDITKDANKIPTLINRTLVPAMILKSNKQLQQPLPAKKQEIHPEPTFKSAEMQPVTISADMHVKPNTLFKPMKLVPFAQKSHSILTTPTAFHDALLEETTIETSANNNTSLLESKDPDAACVQSNLPVDANNSDKVCDITVLPRKKNKVSKKGTKRKTIGTTQSASKKTSMCTNKDNTDILNRKRSETIEPIQEEHREQHNGLSENFEKNEQKNNTKDVTDNITKNSTQMEVPSKVNVEKNVKRDTPSSTTVNEAHTTVKRRESLDEDEEALRAILLASLPKRGKVTETNTSNATSVTTKSTSPNYHDQAVANQTQPTLVAPTVSMTSTKISESNKNELQSEVAISSTVKRGDTSNGIVEETPIAINSVKKRQLPPTKGVQKKVIRKVSIPASTKVVNNAKRYQNAILQKRLNLQKATTLYNQKILENKLVPKRSRNENKWSATSKRSFMSDTQRIIINLESDAESDSESEQQNKEIPCSSNPTGTEKHQPLINPTTEFEKNLDQFLRDVRKKQESVASARPTPSSPTTAKPSTPAVQVDKKSPSNLHTPLAVRHLPVSQQEEYRRLKQQILEREKLRLRRTIENNSSLKNKVTGVASKPPQSSSPNKEQSSPRIDQTALQKGQTTTPQQLNKENIVKQSESPKIATNVGKPGSTSASQTKTLSMSMPNLCIRVATDNTISPSNIGNRIVSNSVPQMKKSRIVIDNIPNTAIKTQTPSGLKILSRDEVNRKFVQVQVKQDTNERVVTINHKPSLNDKREIIRNKMVSENKNTRDKDVADLVSENFIRTVDKENIFNDAQSGNHEESIDSDASTILLPGAGQNRSKEGSLTTTTSTIPLSEYEEHTRTLTNMESIESNSSLSPRRSPDVKESIGENWDAIKKDVKTELSALIKLPRVEQERQLTETEKQLVTKRYMVLDELAEMSGNLRQWDMERDLQTHLVAEVKKLREQLKVAEEKLQEQRDRINSIGPKVVAAHGRINVGRQECFRLSNICSALGSTVKGSEYKVPEAGAQLLDNRIKEVAIHTRQLSRKKVPSIDIPEVSYTSSQQRTSTSSPSETTSNEEFPESDKSYTDETDPTVLTANEYSPETSEVEKTVLQSEVANADKNCSSEQTMDVVSNDLTVDEKGHDTVFDAQPQLSSTPLASKVSQKERHDELSENIRPTASLEESSRTKEDAQKTKKTHLPYVSILTHFKLPRNTNPNGVLCPYELMGTCKDAECQFVHQSESQAK